MSDHTEAMQMAFKVSNDHQSRYWRVYVTCGALSSRCHTWTANRVSLHCSHRALFHALTRDLQVPGLSSCAQSSDPQNLHWLQEGIYIRRSNADSFCFPVPNLQIPNRWPLSRPYGDGRCDLVRLVWSCISCPTLFR